jgi:L-alanine-DL-glutamate epimerase-like enolase superfamily enzyme
MATNECARPFVVNFSAHVPTDAVGFARAVEPFNLMWLEDLLSGDYVPYLGPGLYRELTAATATPVHAGEQICLRQSQRPREARHRCRAERGSCQQVPERRGGRFFRW